MADLPTDTERITQLEKNLDTAIGRLDALEVREAQREAREGATPDADYLRKEIFGAVAGSQDAAALNHFQ